MRNTEVPSSSFVRLLLAVFTVALQRQLEGMQHLKPSLIKLAGPARIDFVDRHRVQVMQFFAILPDDGDQIGLLKQTQMLGKSLTAHVVLFAQFSQGLPVLLPQLVERLMRRLGLRGVVRGQGGANHRRRRQGTVPTG